MNNGSSSSSSITTAAPLLGPSLRLLRQYAESENDAAATLGTRQLHALLQRVGSRLSPQAWVEEVLCDMVQLPAVHGSSSDNSSSSLNHSPSPSSNGNGANHQHHQEKNSSSSSNTMTTDASALSSAAPTTPLTPTTTAVHYRRRCRSSFVAMRCIGELLQVAPAAMPCEVQLRLLTSLGEAVNAARRVNVDFDQRTVMAQTLDDGDGGGGGSFTTDRNISNSRHVSSSSSQAAAAGFAATIGLKAGDWDTPLLPALRRHEVQGGCLLLAALRRSVAHPIALDGDQEGKLEAMKSECERRLTVMCLDIVHTAAAQLGDDHVSGSSNSGDRAVHASLVSDALRALTELPRSAWQHVRGQLFADAAKLVQSPTLEVRKAVQGLMRAQASGSALLSPSVVTPPPAAAVGVSVAPSTTLE